MNTVSRFMNPSSKSDKNCLLPARSPTCALPLDLLTQILDRFSNLATGFSSLFLSHTFCSLLGTFRFEVLVTRQCARRFLDAAYDVPFLAFQFVSVHKSPHFFVK